jgi:hypothetical protein
MFYLVLEANDEHPALSCPPVEDAQIPPLINAPHVANLLFKHA